MKISDWMHTLYFNLKVFDFKTAIKLPVYVGSKIYNSRRKVIEIISFRLEIQ